MKIEELKALRDRITPGKWDYLAYPSCKVVSRNGGVCSFMPGSGNVNGEATAALPGLLDQCIALMEALERISKCDGAPDVDAVGDWQYGLHCGVEDRDCQNRYDGADYGHTVGAEKALEWASNEAQAILNSVGGGEDEY